MELNLNQTALGVHENEECRHLVNAKHSRIKERRTRVFCLKYCFSSRTFKKKPLRLCERACPLEVTVEENFLVFCGFLFASAIRNDVPDKQDIIVHHSNLLYNTSI